MKKIITLLRITCLLFLNACIKDTPIVSSTAVFYSTTNLGHGAIDVTITNGSITPAHVSVPIVASVTDCSLDITVSGYILSNVGTYNYSAIASDGTKWQGTFQISANTCTTIQIQ